MPMSTRCCVGDLDNHTTESFRQAYNAELAATLMALGKDFPAFKFRDFLGGFEGFDDHGL
jgi:hypothetical protein